MEGYNSSRRSAAPSKEGRLAASLAHEINNPLQSLLDLLHLVETEVSVAEPGRRYLIMAEQEARRISEITGAAINQLRHSARPARTNVPELLHSVLEFYRSRFESQGIAVNTRYCPDGELRVYPAALRQTFSNLLLNAADAMPNGGKIYARIAMAEEWGGQKRHGLRLTVADTGCGIAAGDLPRIFEPFFTTKGSAGTGLGLSLVRDTVRKHRGALRVRSSRKPGHSGSVFTIFLPEA